jgi:hypothetical protein
MVPIVTATVPGKPMVSSRHFALAQNADEAPAMIEERDLDGTRVGEIEQDAGRVRERIRNSCHHVEDDLLGWILDEIFNRRGDPPAQPKST